MTEEVPEQRWAALMRRALDGDTNAYHQFLCEVAPFLRRMATMRCERLGASRAEIEDVVQEVLLAIHLKRGTWDHDRPIAPWLSTLVRNKMVDSLRRRGHRVHVPIDDVIDTLPDACETDAGLEMSDVSRLVERLKDPQRVIVRAISIDGMSIQETADTLRMTHGAVRVALHRALKKLADLHRNGTLLR